METEKNHSEALYIQYFNAVEKVREQTDLRKEEKLKLLLEPIISFQNDTSPANRKHKFARDDHINLDEELDLSALEKISDDWIITPDWKLRQFGSLDTSANIISVDFTNFLPKSKKTATTINNNLTRTSIQKLFKDWLPHLDQDRIHSKQLLDQVLLCFTIKRAQNGDEQASEKLISLYIGRAASKETYYNVLKMLVSRGKNIKSTKKKNLNLDDKSNVTSFKYTDDFRQIAKIYLAFIIRGFSPKSILDSMIREPEPEFLPLPAGTVDVFLNYFGEYIPRIVEKYQIHLNCMNDSLKDPSNIHKTIKMAESTAKVIECLNLQVKEGLNVDQLNYLKKNADLLPPDKVAEVTVSVFLVASQLSDSVAPYFATLFDPYTPISAAMIIRASDNKRSSRVLSYCYRPEKMGPRKNLTTWLFGGHGSYNLGKLNQMLADYYSCDADDIDTVPLGDPSALGSSDYSEEESGLRKQIISNIDKIRGQTEEAASVSNDLQEMIEKANISDEDYELLLDRHEGLTLKKLADKYNITQDQVRYKLKSIMKTLQKTTS